MNKRGQGLSLETIIIAIIVIVVLVVLVIVFSTRMGLFKTSVDNCADRGGKCCDTCTGDSFGLPGESLKCTSGQLCCIPAPATC